MSVYSSLSLGLGILLDAYNLLDMTGEMSLLKTYHYCYGRGAAQTFFTASRTILLTSSIGKFSVLQPRRRRVWMNDVLPTVHYVFDRHA